VGVFSAKIEFGIKTLFKNKIFSKLKLKFEENKKILDFLV